ncbi:MAG: hypothetical protein PHS14_05250 [Elusimicrobia bacterium]|nr:hypothetical protein [Elusimicrobiota bacterium]
MKYDDPQPIDRSRAEEMFRSGDPNSICDALIRVALNDPDPVWAEDICLRFISHANVEVRGLAATCLGHIARIHGSLDLAKVIPLLDRLAADPEVGGRAEDALDDIRMHMQKGSA